MAAANGCVRPVDRPRIHGNQAFRFEFADRHVDGPLARADKAQAIEGEIDAFTDAHRTLKRFSDKLSSGLSCRGRDGAESPISACHEIVPESLEVLCEVQNFWL